MARTGVAELPLHGGSAPRWLFERMVKLSYQITSAITCEFGSDEFLRRISDPFWFQAFSCVIGFDWHSSGTTTTACGALKMAINKDAGGDLGIAVCGGKGRTSRKTPQDIKKYGDIFSLSDSRINDLIYSSKIAAKVDNSCIQDSYQLYHHTFIFTEDGKWCIVQQGMNENYARRYHWLSDDVRCFVNEPHSGISSERIEKDVLNMVAKESEQARKAAVDLINDNPDHIAGYFKKVRADKFQRTLTDNYSPDHIRSSLNNFTTPGGIDVNLKLPGHHPVLDMDIGKRGLEVIKRAYEIQPENYEQLISLQGFGPKKIRALALISDLVYGTCASWKDPVKYSFAHGGKDGFPYPVNREVYDSSIETLKDAIKNAKIGNLQQKNALRRLGEFIGQ